MAEEVLRTKRLEIVDDAGEVRLQLDTADPEGAATIAIQDKEGRNRAGFGILLDGSVALILKDEGGTPRASLAVGGPEEGQPRLYLRDDVGRVRVQVSVHDSGEVQIVITDDWGQPRIMLGVDQDAGLALLDKDGVPTNGITDSRSPS